jgi:hypothetical protein
MIDKRDVTKIVSNDIYKNLDFYLTQINTLCDDKVSSDILRLVPSNNDRYLLYISTHQNVLYYYFYSIKDEYSNNSNTDFCIKGKNGVGSRDLSDSIYYGVLFKTNSGNSTFLISDVLVLDKKILDHLQYDARYSILLKYYPLFSTSNLNSRLKIRISPLFSTSNLALCKTSFKYSNQCTHVSSITNTFYKQLFTLDWTSKLESFKIKYTDYGNIFDIYSITTDSHYGKIYIPIDKQSQFSTELCSNQYLSTIVTCKFNTQFQKWTLA